MRIQRPVADRGEPRKSRIAGLPSHEIGTAGQAGSGTDRAVVKIARGRRGFTLTELLVVIAILLILAGISITAFNTTTSSDRIRSGARQLQSALLGARDRAIFSQRVSGKAEKTLSRGLRLVAEPGAAGSRRVVRQMVYIQETDPVDFSHTLGVAVQLRRIEIDGDTDMDGNIFEGSEPIRVIREVVSDGTDTPLGVNPPPPSYPEFQRLKDEGFLKEGMRVLINEGGAAGSGTYYMIQFTNPLTGAPSPYDQTRSDELYLVRDFVPSSSRPQSVVAFDRNQVSMRIELPPQPIVAEQPLQMPAGIAIDIDADSVLSRADLPPAGWVAVPAAGDPAYYDILFDARGSITGLLGSSGQLSFLLADERDLEEGLNPASTNSRGEWMAISLFTQTGFVLSSQVDTTDAVNNTSGASGADGKADNPFRYARMGEAASR